ncbi:hypothetical protein VTN96DRAFT_1876 [Rasamsonia emersonii]
MAICDIPSVDRPHIQCDMIYNIDGDDRLLRGELLALIRIILGVLSATSLVDHLITPVLLFSYMGPQHGRILQGHFDGDNLVVRYSKLYDFRKKNNYVVKLFTQWLLCHPTGNTKAK